MDNELNKKDSGVIENNTNEVQLNWDEFEEKYQPLTNHLDKNASLSGYMFETYDDEYDFVCEIHKETPERVWTYIESGDAPNESVVVNGLHIVRRLGYIVTQEGADTGQYISVQ